MKHLLIALCLAGCASTYVRNGQQGETHNLDAAHAKCRAQTNQAVTQDFAGISFRRHMKECMAGEGWEKQ